MNNLFSVILCGGSGTRLWPLSRKTLPKQFLNLIDEETLFAKTYSRAKIFSPDNKPLVVTLTDYKYLVTEELRKMKSSANVLCEPVAKNTCPAITAAALAITSKTPSGIMLIMPSDHLIVDEKPLKKAIDSAIPLAHAKKLVTFGIEPKTPETGFGYIKMGAPFLNGFEVEKFTEKPEEATAESYLKDGSYLWNTGIFLFNADVFLKAVEKHSPDILNNVRKAFNASDENQNLSLDHDHYHACPSDSIDFAVLEKAEDVAVMPMELNWNDIGSWKSISRICNKDNSENTSQGNVFLSNSRRTFVRAESRLVAVTGMDDTLIVETPDAVLVTPLDKTQEIKTLVSDLAEAGREESHQAKVVHRPWGTYETIAIGKNYQVKRIIVFPGQSLSLQKHKLRSEHWTVVVGRGLVNLNENLFELSTNESTFIPAGSTHRLSNETEEVLEIIEVQTGAYLGEDDIIRYDDIYGRADEKN